MSKAPRPRPSLSCVECGRQGVLTDGDRVYPHRPDLHDRSFYVCPCGARVGCHKGTTDPLGRPCGPATARARNAAHAAFDPLWKTKIAQGFKKREARGAGYLWLAREMGLAPPDCHISHFDRAQALQVVAIVKAWRDAVRARRHNHDNPSVSSSPRPVETPDDRSHRQCP